MNFDAKSSSQEKLNMLVMTFYAWACTAKVFPESSNQRYFIDTAKINMAKGGSMKHEVINAQLSCI